MVAAATTGAAVSSSSFRPLISDLKMRIDWPRDRAKIGSLEAPNSATNTTATMSRCGPLNNPSPMADVLSRRALSVRPDAVLPLMRTGQLWWSAGTVTWSRAV